MSFFTSNRPDLVPGPIVGNPLNGLCERVCIQTKKVFDACIRQIEQLGTQVVVINMTPASPTLPLTFTSCASDGVDATIANLIIDRFDDAPNFARVSADIIIPIIVTYVDANGIPGHGDTTVTVHQDVILYVPQPSIIPISVEAIANAICAGGVFVSDSTFSLDLCITVMLKIVAEVDLLIPTYGYCQIPPCQEFTEEACPGLFNLPLFPQPEV